MGENTLREEVGEKREGVSEKKMGGEGEGDTAGSLEGSTFAQAGRGTKPDEESYWTEEAKRFPR